MHRFFGCFVNCVLEAVITEYDLTSRRRLLVVTSRPEVDLGCRSKFLFDVDFRIEANALGKLSDVFNRLPGGFDNLGCLFGRLRYGLDRLGCLSERLRDGLDRLGYLSKRLWDGLDRIKCLPERLRDGLDRLGHGLDRLLNDVVDLASGFDRLIGLYPRLRQERVSP
jgi:hypothetical protein